MTSRGFDNSVRSRKFGLDTKLSVGLRHLVDEYIKFNIENKHLSVPYAIASSGVKKFGIGEARQPAKVGRYKNFAGKGSPSQIRRALIKVAHRRNFDLKKASSVEIKLFMLDEGIGVDCSGFVYNVLDGYLKETKSVSLDQLILRYPGIKGLVERRLRRRNRVRRSSAATLTSDLNSTKVDRAEEIRPGDMLRLTHPDWRGKHIAIIVEVTKTSIVYAMSSDCTEVTGVHFGVIEVLDPTKGLEAQRWLEVTKDGQNYKEYAFHPDSGDAVRRPKSLEGS